jgi:tetratricopeptide (TPR) repeat protein
MAQIAKSLVLALLLLTSYGGPAKAAPELVTNTASEEENQLDYAFLLAEQKRSQEALTVAEAMIAAHDKIAATEKRIIYSAHTPAEALAYMVRAATKEQPAVAMSGSWGQALFLKAFVLIDLGRGEEAHAFLQQAITLSPLNSQYLGELGEWYKMRGRWDDALVYFRRAESASELSPDEVKTLHRSRAKRGIGFVLIEQNNLDAAEAEFRECLKLNPNDKMAQSELAYIASRRSSASN